MTPRDYDSVTDYDPHEALFGDEEDDRDPRPYPDSRAERRRAEREQDHSHRRRSRRGWLILILTLALAVAVVIVLVPKLVDHFRTDDYSGDGASYPKVSVTVRTGDTAADIGKTLAAAKVVASATAFTDAADADSDSQSIQPGVYDVHEHQSGKNALTALLDPASRNTSNSAVIPEGANKFTVTDNLAKVLGRNQAGAIRQALSDPANLGIPVGYTTSAGKSPNSVEGFLYPATYTFDPNTTPTDALTTIVTRFISADRTSNFAAQAKTLGVTPYEALTVASIIQAEAKFDDDMPKVAEVIYNRLRAGSRLQIDATTKYGCEIASEPHCIYSKFPTPYNSYLHDGLPPTPIDNPGAQAMAAAVTPAKGTFKYYVNGDKDGHLYFTASASKFDKAAEKCRKNNWGCG